MPLQGAFTTRTMNAVVLLALLVSTAGRTTDDSQRGKQKYFWKTGSWGACVAEPSVCGEGRRERPVWCSEPDGRTVLQFQCDPAAEPPAHKPCFVACRHHKDKLQWQVGGWGPCLPVVLDGKGLNGARSSNTGVDVNGIAGSISTTDSGQGVMQRNVTCVLMGATGRPARTVDEENCLTAARKPDTARLCHIPRPQDCVVGPFSSWSTCPRGCDGDTDEDGSPDHPANQTRVRSVLVAPLHGGRECPPLSEWRACKPPRPRSCPAPPLLPPVITTSPTSGAHGSQHYRLKLGEWRRCQPPSAVVIADSYPHGNVGALGVAPPGALVSGGLSSEAKPSAHAPTVPGSVPYAVPNAAPDAAPGAAPDPVPDAISVVVSLGSANLPPPPPLPPPGVGSFPTHRVGPGAASSSSTDPADAYNTFQPRVGLQIREISCRDSHGSTVQLSLCLGETSGTTLPSRVRPCVVPEDCVVSQWSAWTRTQDGCVTAGGRVRPEIQIRKREVVRLPEGDGRQCPHLLETRRSADRDALPPCAQKYRWLASKWSPCVVTSDEMPTASSGIGGSHTLEVGCGGGVQLRDVTCVAASSGRPVNADLCTSLQPLPTVQRCEVACPRDCEVGEWGEWGPCRPLDCPQSGEPPTEGYRERRRTVLVQPSEQGVPCPAATEVQPCPQPACHHWVEGPWGSCELRPGVKHCGEGRRSRPVACRTLHGKPTDESSCLRSRPRPESEEPCLLPCPYDCVLSPWSDWSPCSHACSSPRHAALRQRNRTVVAPSGPGGHPCPNPDELLQMEPCNVHSCHGFSWLTLPWQPCLSTYPRGSVPGNFGENASGAENKGAYMISSVSGTNVSREPAIDCGRGVQEREVWCMEANDKHVDDSRCQPLPKPETSRPCMRPCPVDCEMSPWSEWSPCPQHCIPDASGEARDGEVTPTQTRARVALRWPRHGGAPCPSGEELRPCPLSGARCRRYAWGTGHWSECRLPAQLNCGVGYRTRPVWCYRNHPSSKVEPSMCYEHNGTAPSQSEPCYVDCDLPCVLSAWGPWSTCRHACSARTRSRTLLGLSAARDACRNSTRFPLAQAASCPCDRYTLATEGEWSECVLERPLAVVTANGRPAPGACGAGTRTRRAACRDKTGALVEPSLCGVPSGLQEEPCLVPCPADCLLSEWTPWGPCSALCGPGVQARTRRILRESANSGRPCGSVLESKLCHEPCEHFKWVAAGWGDCQLIGADRARGCGTGDQFRKVRCMKFRPHDIPEEVADPYCDPLTQPADVNACHVACPGDCVLSPWSDWSECPKPCEWSQEQGRERQRTRSVLRGPASDGERCPPLIEVQACRLNVTCFTYSWRATAYSSCLPLGGSPCGEGVQARAVYCHRSDGRPVSDSLCSEQDRPTPTEMWCYVDCPVDCEVSSWTSWNATQCRCGDAGGQQSRRRNVLTPSSPRGRPCPLPLVQTRPCPARPCYAWDVGSWGACDLHGAWCGHGVVRRDVRCLRDGVTPVEPRLCRREQRRRGALASSWDDTVVVSGWTNAADDDTSFALTAALFPPLPRPEELRSQDSCYVPCRGDCHVSEWSRWSHCHRDCRGPDVGGYQTRSRAVLKSPASGGEPCPTALWETRPCFSGPCLSFDWTVTADGSLACRRSDGVVVVGGCDGRPRPCSARVECEVIGARCDVATGRCACSADSSPRFEAGRLVACNVVPMSASPPRGPPNGVVTGNGGQRRAGVPDVHDADAEQRATRPDLGGMDQRRPHDDATDIQSRFYYPKDDDINIWMFAMIGIGCVFIIFVAVSLYIMCYRKSNDEDGRYLFVQQEMQQKVL